METEVSALRVREGVLARPDFFVMFSLGDGMQIRFALMIGRNQMGHCTCDLGDADGSSLGCVLLVCCVWRGWKIP